MAHPINELAKALEQRTLKRKAARQLSDVMSQKHLADDLGLPYRPRKESNPKLWVFW